MASVETLAPSLAFHHQESEPPQPTVSLSETTYQNQTPCPSTPNSMYIKDEYDVGDGDGEGRKPTKKRKSWGQELPTPKTNLPPRKRAKTEDEKEQRRIERVLRNRAAAQSSRERKRQEVEKLEGEKSDIEHQNQILKDRILAVEHEKWLLKVEISKMKAQMKASSRGSSTPSMAASPPPEPLQLFDGFKILQEIEDYSFSMPTPRSYTSPSSQTMTYSSPSQSPSQPSLCFEDSSMATSPDMTQHPAAMFPNITRGLNPTAFGDVFDFDLFPTEEPLQITTNPKDIFGINTLQPDFSLNTNDFGFDSLVDFEGHQHHESDDSHSEIHDHASPSDSSASHFAESFTQQPSIGASA